MSSPVLVVDGDLRLLKLVCLAHSLVVSLYFVLLQLARGLERVLVGAALDQQRSLERGLHRQRD